MTTDTITCIDRYKYSPAYGERILPFATLLDRPRTLYTAEQMTGAVGHGFAVEILEKKQDNGDLWCKVRATDVKDEQTYIQEGWVKRQFLEREGESYFEAVNGTQRTGDEVI